MKNIIFVSDYFANEISRGAELCNKSLLFFLERDYKITTIQSYLLNYIDPGYFYIVTNFCNLSEQSKQQLIKYKNYLIYEHDHKYVQSRNPFRIPEENSTGIVPKEKLINLEFYDNAKIVICQTQWHEDQLNKNGILNTTNIHGSIYTPDELNLIDSIRSENKIDKYAIFNDAEFIILSNGDRLFQGSNIKNKSGALKYCIDNKLNYIFIPRINKQELFWKTLNKFKYFVFLPDIPETCSRLLIELKMLGVEPVTNTFTGAYYETWFKLQGKELVEEFKNNIIPNTIKLFKDYL